MYKLFSYSGILFQTNWPPKIISLFYFIGFLHEFLVQIGVFHESPCGERLLELAEIIPLVIHHHRVDQFGPFPFEILFNPGIHAQNHHLAVLGVKNEIAQGLLSGGFLQCSS